MPLERPLVRPFVFINSAMSADGKMSSYERRQVRISGPSDISRVASLRADSDAIMVGVGTVLADDPGLRIRSEDLRASRRSSGLPENPIRVVADSRARTPPDSDVLGEGCILAVSEAAPPYRLDRLSDKCDIVVCGREQVDLRGLLALLHARGVRRLMVEGGATINWSLLSRGLVDEIYVYIGAMIIGGADAPTLVDGEGFKDGFPRLSLISAETGDDGILLRWRVLPSP